MNIFQKTGFVVVVLIGSVLIYLSMLIDRKFK